MLELETPVKVFPPGKTVYVLPGTRLVEAVVAAGPALDLPCGGEGTCGKCRVRVTQGAGEPGPAERRAFTAEELDQGFRLACQVLVNGPLAVEIPPTSLLSSSHKILARTEGAVTVAADPAVYKRYVELPPPERGSDEADLGRLQRAIGPVEPDLEFLRELPARLRENEFRGTAVVAGDRLIDFEQGNTEQAAYAVAVDVGTTTLVAMLLDLRAGEELAVAARLNPQTRFGDDVLSRILYAQETPAGLAELQGAVAGAVNEMVGELVDQARIDRRRIYEITFSGNTTMQELLCGIDPRWLGEVPFVPATSGRILVAAASLGIEIHPRGRAYVMPVIGGFVGGDTVSGILATTLTELPGPCLLVDIGTNGEIVLWAHGKLAAASTAAGPAFEGARITHGMRASAGAIEKVLIDGHLRVNVIGGVRPVGLCGSALIDAAAELLRHGILASDGRLASPGRLPENVLPDLRRRLVTDNGKSVFVLVSAEESGTGKPVLLTQRDFRELQLASGAIRAGIGTLLRREGLEPADLETVLVAGGFGNFIRRKNAQRIGLLPHQIPRQRIRYQGNTSLAGARLAAVSQKARQAAEQLARQTEHVDLSSDPHFSWAFAESMIFPDES
jgi:uncharacterized 2Fe-2S/4Fe-4S cluster protein (DUF4445 family)